MPLGPVTINLDPAAVLYREKLLIRTRGEIGPEVIELPSFTWEIEKKRVPDLGDKDMVRNWMRYLAIASAAVAEKTKGDLAFVVLVRIQSDDRTFSLAVHCPYSQIVEPLWDKATLESRFVGTTPDIRHKYALLDAQCPVVVAYSAASNEVLLTNENHIGNPMQFLEPEHCSTTSGLLNFIGALSLLEALKPDDAPHERAGEWVKSAIAARNDEWLRWFFHLAAERVVLDPKRILVVPDSPETYFYDYVRARDQGAEQ